MDKEKEEKKEKENEIRTRIVLFKELDDPLCV